MYVTDRPEVITIFTIFESSKSSRRLKGALRLSSTGTVPWTGQHSGQTTWKQVAYQVSAGNWRDLVRQRYLRGPPVCLSVTREQQMTADQGKALSLSQVRL